MIVVTLIVCMTILVWKMLDVMAENPELFKEEKKNESNVQPRMSDISYNSNTAVHTCDNSNRSDKMDIK